MADAVQITVDYVKLDSRLMKLAAGLANPTALLEQLGLEGERIIKLNFKSGGRPDKWKVSRRARKQGGQTLMDTGNLRSSVSHQIVGREVAVGSNVKYGPIHHFGGTINHPGGTPYIIMAEGQAKWLRKDGSYPAGVRFTRAHPIPMPARPWLVFPPGSAKKFNAIVRDNVEKI